MVSRSVRSSVYSARSPLSLFGPVSTTRSHSTELPTETRGLLAGQKVVGRCNTFFSPSNNWFYFIHRSKTSPLSPSRRHAKHFDPETLSPWVEFESTIPSVSAQARIWLRGIQKEWFVITGLVRTYQYLPVTYTASIGCCTSTPLAYNRKL